MKTNISKPSYWKECYDLVGCGKNDVNDNPNDVMDVDKYWMKVMKIEDEDRKLKYKNLGKLALIVLLLSHGNADPERGSSINKRLLEKHGSSIDEDTLDSIWIVKDFLIHSGGQNNVEITPEMMKECKSSNEKYKIYLAEKEKKKKNAKKQKQLKKEAEKKKKVALRRLNVI